MVLIALLSGASRTERVANIFFTDFSSDTHPYYNASGDAWPYDADFLDAGWSAPDAVMRGQGVSVYAGEGKGGVKNGLWCANNPATVMAYDSSVWYQITGDATDDQLVPVGYAAGAKASFSLMYKAESFAYDEVNEYYADLFHLVKVSPPYGYSLELELQDDSSGANDWTYYLSWEQWNGGNQSYEVRDVYVGSSASLLDDEWRDYVVTYKPGTLTDWDSVTGPVVTADGWITVTVNGSTLFNEQNIALVVNGWGYAANELSQAQSNVNRPEFLYVGGSLAGAYDSISFGDLEDSVDVPFLPLGSTLHPPAVYDPAREATFLSDAMGVLVWIEWPHVDSTGVPKTLVFSKVPLADRSTDP